jgi:hypothetical protein
MVAAWARMSFCSAGMLDLPSWFSGREHPLARGAEASAE